jgi:peroxiredoxin
MKKLLYLIISSTILFGCVDKNNSRFKGGSVLIDVKLENMSTKLVALEILSTSKTKTTQLDTLEVDENGSAKFYYNALKTSFYSIYLPEEKDGNGGVMFMAEPGDTINISGNAKKLYATSKIGGTPEAEKLDSLITFLKASKFYTDSLDYIFQRAKSKELHHALMEDFQILYAKAKRKEEKIVLNYINTDPGQFSNLVALSSLDKKRHKNTFQKVDSALIIKYNGNEDVINFHNRIEELYSNSIGEPAHNFELMDIDNKIVKLSDYKGKYVLIDFWATWCRPCIAEIPNLKKIKTDFGDANFEIISVCIDRDNQATIDSWKRINEKFQTNWIQLFDANGEGTSKQYKIEHYPTLMIIDPNGNILDKGDHIRGETAHMLVKKLVGND